jgi:hypothetical protein
MKAIEDGMARLEALLAQAVTEDRMAETKTMR